MNSRLAISARRLAATVAAFAVAVRHDRSREDIPRGRKEPVSRVKDRLENDAARSCNAGPDSSGDVGGSGHRGAFRGRKRLGRSFTRTLRHEGG